MGKKKKRGGMSKQMKVAKLNNKTALVGLIASILTLIAALMNLLRGD
jgi:hypothetical protein